jgi:FdrA protein
VTNASANDLILAVEARSKEAAELALASGERAGIGTSAGPSAVSGDRRAAPVRSIEEAVNALPGANVAMVSTPGAYAVLEAHKALTSGMHVLLFSDNVSLEDEAALKQRGSDRGLLVMGPGAGTAVLGGVGLGFANAVRRGSVGVVAAAGTGAQEVMTLVHRWGGGIRNVIAIGGRDLSARIGGKMAELGLDQMAKDPAVEVVLLVSKPPDPAVAARLLAGMGARPSVFALIGLEESLETPEGVRLARTLDEAAAMTVEELGLPRPDLSSGMKEMAEAAFARLSKRRTAVRGLFSGGTLCYESMVVLSEHLGLIRSNTPLRDEWALPAATGDHVCLDLGEEEYTRGRPHPMIDPEARLELIRREASDPQTAVILIDVVLGYGSHPDPASALAGTCAEITRGPDSPAIVAYVLGTDLDPQGLELQQDRLAEAGCVLATTGAGSARLAAAIASRRPELAGYTS